LESEPAEYTGFGERRYPADARVHFLHSFRQSSKSRVAPPKNRLPFNKKLRTYGGHPISSANRAQVGHLWTILSDAGWLVFIPSATSSPSSFDFIFNIFLCGSASLR
jgi:hypothetical protein